MTVSGDREDEPRRDRLEALVRLDDKVSEAAEAAAKAAAHAVEATKAAEAAAEARLARKSESVRDAKAERAATKAKKAKGEASRAARAAKKASEQTGQHVPAVDEPTRAPGSEAHALELSLTDTELERLHELAAEQDVPVPQVARALLRQALEQSDD